MHRRCRVCDGIPHWCSIPHRPKESPASNEIISTKPVSVLQKTQAEGKNPPQVAKIAKPHETKQKGASVQEVELNVPSGSRAIVLPQHNTNEGSGSNNEEPMRESTIPPSECTNKVKRQAELAVPQTWNEQLLIKVPASDLSKSKIVTYQSDDIKPSLETDKEKPAEVKERLGTGKDQPDEVKRSVDRAKDEPDHVSRPLGTSKDQTDDGSRSLEIAKELGESIKRSLEADIEQQDDAKAKDQPGDANICLGTAKDQQDYVKRAKGLESTNKSLGRVKEELEDVQRSSGIAKEQPDDDDQRSLGTVKEEQKKVKRSLDAKKPPDDTNMCSLVNDQPDDAKRAVKNQVDNVQRPLGAVIEQLDDVTRSVGTAKEQLDEVKGFIALSKEQLDDVTRALERGKEEPDDATRTLTAKEQSDDVKVGSHKNISPGISVVPQPVPSLQHEKSPDSLTETNEEPSAVSEERLLLEKIHQMAEDTDTSPLSDPVPVPVPVFRPRKRLVPSKCDFDLPPTPPLQHRACTTSPEHADQSELPLSEVIVTNDLRMAVTSVEPTVDAAELHADGTETWKSQNEWAMVLEDERKETLNSKAYDETLEQEKVPADRVSAENELDEAQIETLIPAPVPDDL